MSEGPGAPDDRYYFADYGVPDEEAVRIGRELDRLVAELTGASSGACHWDLLVKAPPPGVTENLTDAEFITVYRTVAGKTGDPNV